MKNPQIALVFWQELLSEFSILPSLVTMSFVKVEIWNFYITTWSHVGDMIKWSCDFKSVNLSQKVSTLSSLVSLGIVLVEI